MLGLVAGDTACIGETGLKDAAVQSQGPEVGGIFEIKGCG